LVQGSITNGFVAFRRLVEQGKGELAYATPLAMHAMALFLGRLFR